MTRSFLTAMCLLLCCSALGAQEDVLSLTDGRFVFGKEMTKTPEGVLVHFTNGDVKVPMALVKEAVTSKNLGTKEAAVSAKDQEKLDRGLVKFNGRWMKKGERSKKLAKIQSERKAKINEALAHRKWRNHYTLKTKNFLFKYTIDPEIMQRYSVLMESYFKTFTKAWKIRKPSGTKRLEVCFYHDAEYFHQVGGAPRGVIGYYRFVDPKSLHFYFDRQDERLTIDVMFHETNHYLTHLINLKFNYPAWVNESLAEYYGASEWNAKTKKMSSGHIQDGRLMVIKDEIAGGSWLGLEEMMRIPRFNAVHYAWGWSFIHFLMSNPKYEKNFKRFYVAMARDKSIDKVPWSFGMKEVPTDEQIRALKKFLKVKSLKTLETEWHEYIKQMQPRSARGFAHAGKTFLGQGMPLKAIRFLKNAIDKGDDDPSTYNNLGRALIRKGRSDEAKEQFENAIKRDPLRGMFYINLANCLRGSNQEEVEAERNRLRKLAVEVEPGNFQVLQLSELYNALDEDG